jgi:uncharacterized BrkB/YihY/UPF0761 family membrane protein
MTEQMSYFLDKSAVDVVQGIAQKASQSNKGVKATSIGILLALFGASGVFGQLQDALNTIWGVKANPEPELQSLYALVSSPLLWWQVFVSYSWFRLCSKACSKASAIMSRQCSLEES